MHFLRFSPYYFLQPTIVRNLKLSEFELAVYGGAWRPSYSTVKSLMRNCSAADFSLLVACFIFGWKRWIFSLMKTSCVIHMHWNSENKYGAVRPSVGRDFEFGQETWPVLNVSSVVWWSNALSNTVQFVFVILPSMLSLHVLRLTQLIDSNMLGY